MALELNPNRQMRCSLVACGLGVLLCSAAFVCAPVKALARWDAPPRAADSAKAQAAPDVAIADFAIADFDGDAEPDLATVQSGAALASRTNYWIHFAFAAGRERSIAVLGPSGGLQIASQDVNGDSFLDVVVSTRLANEPVAVLLNDGRGNFRLADPRGFAATIWEAPAGWRTRAGRLDYPGAALYNAGWTAGVLLPGARFVGLPPLTEGLTRSRVHGIFGAVACGVRGRAPPQA